MLCCHVAARRGLLPAAALVAVLLTGCAGGDQGPGAGLGQGLGCVDDSWECVNKRQAALKTLMADSSRAWIKDTPSPHAYASGVRLFAYRGKKKELTCEEVNAGRREADGAAAALRGPGGVGLTPAQVSRGVMLAGEVSKELGNEYNRRCKRG